MQSKGNLSGIPVMMFLTSQRKYRSKNPKIYTLHKIATAFGMTLCEFLDYPELNEYDLDEDENED